MFTRSKQKFKCCSVVSNTHCVLPVMCLFWQNWIQFEELFTLCQTAYISRFYAQAKAPLAPQNCPPPKKKQKASQGTTILVLKYRVRVLLLALPYTGTTSLDSGIGVGGNLQLKLMTATFGALPWLICFHLSVCVCLCVCVRSSDGKSRSTRAAF